VTSPPLPPLPPHRRHLEKGAWPPLLLLPPLFAGEVAFAVAAVLRVAAVSFRPRSEWSPGSFRTTSTLSLWSDDLAEGQAPPPLPLRPHRPRKFDRQGRPRGAAPYGNVGKVAGSHRRHSEGGEGEESDGRRSRGGRPRGEEGNMQLVVVVVGSDDRVAVCHGRDPDCGIHDGDDKEDDPRNRVGLVEGNRRGHLDVNRCRRRRRGVAGDNHRDRHPPNACGNGGNPPAYRTAGNTPRRRNRAVGAEERDASGHRRHSS